MVQHKTIHQHGHNQPRHYTLSPEVKTKLAPMNQWVSILNTAITESRHDVVSMSSYNLSKLFCWFDAKEIDNYYDTGEEKWGVIIKETQSDGTIEKIFLL